MSQDITEHQRESPSPPQEFFTSEEVETLKSVLGRPHARPDDKTTTAEPRRQPDQQSKPKTMFFYGSLMDPDTLRFIAQTSAAPELPKASIRGFKLKMWGPYPALVPGAPDDTVQGVYWRPGHDGQLDLLQQYETDVYRPAACAIRAEEHGSTIRDGLAFVWAGDPASDELHDGEFSLEMYQLYFKPDSFKREEED